MIPVTSAYKAGDTQLYYCDELIKLKYSNSNKPIKPIVSTVMRIVINNLVNILFGIYRFVSVYKFVN